MRWLWFFPLLVYANNVVTVNVDCQITVNPNGTEPKFSAQFYTSNLVQSYPPATIFVTGAPTVASLSTVKKSSFIDAGFTLNAVPDPLAPNGYTVAANLLTQYISLDVQSSLFQNFRLFPISGSQTDLLNANFIGMTVWFQRVDSEAFTTGVQISPTLTNDNVIVSITSTAASQPFTLRFSSNELLAISPGVYWMELIVQMSPYAATFDQIETNTLEVTTQLNVLDAYIGQIDGYLTNNNSVYKVTPQQATVLQNNKKLLQQESKDIINANSNIL